ncbi:MAG: HK97 gp10 family phage protein [Clostridiaceae bacterium]|nr:HK97 gp10 family phage protein [Clostridiaceae bacterium]
MKSDDVFGFDELISAMDKVSKNYPRKADALLVAQGKILQKEVKGNTPVLKRPRKGRTAGDLKKSWRFKAVKEYKGGSVKVVRVQSTAPHAHLIEDGHMIVTTPYRHGIRTKTGRVDKLNSLQRKMKGVTFHGKTKGVKMLRNSKQKVTRSFYNGVEKMLDELTEDMEI